MRTQRRKGNPKAGRDQSRQALVLCLLALPVLVALYILIAVVIARPVSSGRQLRIDQFLAAVQQNQVRSATILPDDSRIAGTYTGGKYWVEFGGGHETLFARLTSALEQGAVPTTVQRQPAKALVGPANVLLPALIVLDGIFVLLLMTRGGAMSRFGRAGARRAGDGDGDTRITFDDLAGVDEAVEELAEVRDFLLSPEKYAAIGASVPKGILLDGPPGCGKTRLARALAGASAVPFFSISGSDFVEMYVGVGAARIRDLFATAKASAPAIVFIDELDAVGRARSTTTTGGQDERESALNQLLVEMDGFDATSGVVVVAATNRADILDTALLRPGRFDRRITVDPPDRRGREGILAVHTRDKPLHPDVDLGVLAGRTSGLSGAELANVVNEAALLATREGASVIGPDHLTEAVERVVAGLQRRSRVLSDEDRRRIAYHEAGHAVVATALGEPGQTVTKISLVARRSHGGATWYAGDGDRLLATQDELEHRIAALLGGREAEVVEFGQSSTGATDDLRRAALMARTMVWECGMGERIRATGEEPSERLRSDVDAEAEDVLAEAQDLARRTLLANHLVVVCLANALLQEETLEGPALDELLARVHSAHSGGVYAVPA
ncbi:MAG: ATP-dependent zinc metalloprotease FtsH [Acidimicrobiales bacterium]